MIKALLMRFIHIWLASAAHSFCNTYLFKIKLLWIQLFIKKGNKIILCNPLMMNQKYINLSFNNEIINAEQTFLTKYGASTLSLHFLSMT